MSEDRAREVAANLERAEQSLGAARDLLEKGYHDFAASRAYYSAFYAATAILLIAGLEFGKHSGVVASIHQRFVKTGNLTKEQGKNLNWLFELRSVGDYGGVVHVSQPQCEQAIRVAEDFLVTIKSLIE
ncbi:MAG: HEPN domain-containing protein [Chloroflexi bacterium]|nr:HEPN domain-containing protein [Chloroflexota bacterium]